MTTKAIASVERSFRVPASRTPSPQPSPVASNESLFGGTVRQVPLFISADEAYYWSSPWQRDVLESMRALRDGEFMDFDSDDPTDAAQWLLSVDEDDCD
jgi:hypothetical protein